MRIGTPDLIATLRRERNGNILLRDGSFIYVVFLNPVRMRPIVRQDTELFTKTVARRAKSFDVVVNGNFFDVTSDGKLDALIGHDPVPATETLIEGQVVLGGGVIAGDARPQGFYFAEVLNTAKAGRKAKGWHYETGRGNPPTGSRAVAAIGNMGPLISNKLPYGAGNEYGGGRKGPATGDPGPALRSSLTQRNNNLFKDVNSRPASLGKTILAYHAAEGALLVGVQPDGLSPGQKHIGLRQALQTAGFSDAVFADGSDSAMLWHKGRCVVRPGEDKDELMTVGLGFAQAPIASATKPRRP